MTKTEMIDLLQGALMRERQHFNFYQHAQYVLKGLFRLYLGDFFKKEMHGELEHMQVFADKIVALGGIPTIESYALNASDFSTPLKMINAAIKMEREVISFYHSMYPSAEKYAETYDDLSIVLLIEDNIEDSTRDVEEMEKLALMN